MKKSLCIVLALVTVLAFAACSGKGDPGSDILPSDGAPADENTTAAPISDAPGYTNGMQEHFDQLEYVAYTDLFYNQNTKDYAGREFTKTGNFASIVDCYNGNITRYYVWGYADTTKCCCYQWEFVAPEGWTAPENGSSVTVKGTLVADEKSLDGYWFDNCEITVDKEFEKSAYDYDLTRISPTLVYVQIANMLSFPENFADATMRVYGRAYSVSTIQHPYYDGSWQLDFKWDGQTPAIGEYIVLEGNFRTKNGGCFTEATNVTIVD